MNADRQIAFAKPSITDSEIDAVTRVMKSGWLTTGEEAKKFEQEFAAAVSSPHAVAVNSATAGLHLALEAFGIGPGDTVLVPTFTFAATAEVVLHVGATVKFVDIDPATQLIDLDAVERLLASDMTIRAVIPVHFAGQACDLDRLMDMAAKFGIAVIEDAAHAFPASCSGRPIGSIGHATVFSFYATKTMTTGEGGMVATAVGEVAERMRTMRLHGISRDVFDRYRTPGAAWRYDVVAPGFKYNLTDMAAAIGRVQLGRANSMRRRRQDIAGRYDERLSHLPLFLPTVRCQDDIHAWHLYTVQLRDNCPLDRDALVDALAARGIGTSVHFIPLHRQMYWNNKAHVASDAFPNADLAFSRIMSLPIYSSMTDDDVDYVATSIDQVVRAASSGPAHAGILPFGRHAEHDARTSFCEERHVA